MGACFSGCIPARVLVGQCLASLLFISQLGKYCDAVKVPAFDAHLFSIGLNGEGVLLLGLSVTVFNDYALDDFNPGKPGAFSGSSKNGSGEYNFITGTTVAGSINAILSLSCILLEDFGAFLVSIPTANCGHFVFGFVFCFHFSFFVL